LWFRLATALLLGFSVYASFQGGSAGYSEERSTTRELRSLNEVAKVAKSTPPLPGANFPCPHAHHRESTKV
jgi:hypothetical protein